MMNRLKQGWSSFAKICEAAVLLLLFSFFVSLAVISFVSFSQQSAVNEALLRELIRSQPSSSQIVAYNKIEELIHNQTGSEMVSLEYISEVAVRAGEANTGVYVTSFFIGDSGSVTKPNQIFELTAEDENPDNRYFAIRDGTHLIGRPLIYERSQPVYQLIVTTILDDGTTINFPLDVHIDQPAAVSLDRSKPALQKPKPERSISPVFTSEIQHWSAEIVAWGESHQIDPDMIATIMQIESCGNPEARSSAGAQGLFQVMPHHFEAGENMFAPNINAERGLAYFKQGLVLHGGDVDLAFAGYNAGHGTVQAAADSEWPKETQQYHYWSRGIYLESKAGIQTSDTLQEWLAFGGTSLCESAADKLGI